MKDLASRPKSGRFFAISFSELKRQIRELDVVDHLGEHLAIRMASPKQDHERGFLLYQLDPNQTLTLFSLPNEIASDAAMRIGKLAIVELAQFHRPAPPLYDRGRITCFRAYFNETHIEITRRDVRYSMDKYRGTSKFSHAFKTKLSSVNERLLSEKTHNTKVTREDSN